MFTFCGLGFLASLSLHAGHPTSLCLFAREPGAVATPSSSSMFDTTIPFCVRLVRRRRKLRNCCGGR
ncbi:hypothetical protein PR003_g11331 [Phytophthora rubi]|uniref:Secreted protein n=1 Tax=Phytophthora rubi TaxID=129364 RepID=A0A6A4F8J8_9STRA|nr:hypothetical protein PR003_g11331 [Phytophthora rubi]